MAAPADNRPPLNPWRKGNGTASHPNRKERNGTYFEDTEGGRAGTAPVAGGSTYGRKARPGPAVSGSYGYPEAAQAVDGGFRRRSTGAAAGLY